MWTVGDLVVGRPQHQQGGGRALTEEVLNGLEPTQNGRGGTSPVQQGGQQDQQSGGGQRRSGRRHGRGGGGGGAGDGGDGGAGGIGGQRRGGNGSDHRQFSGYHHQPPAMLANRRKIGDDTNIDENVPSLSSPERKGKLPAHDGHGHGRAASGRTIGASAVKDIPTPTTEAEDLMTALVEGLTNYDYECMICYDVVKGRDRVWSCSVCYAVFHLKCVEKWSRKSAQEVSGSNTTTSTGGWRCPGSKHAIQAPAARANSSPHQSPATAAKRNSSSVAANYTPPPPQPPPPRIPTKLNQLSAKPAAKPAANPSTAASTSANPLATKDRVHPVPSHTPKNASADAVKEKSFVAPLKR
ncbi:Transcriptional repressor NF-X1 [Quaeritorhiza haematococci]|nr:Transcriptional repressor NF-X1 [Quaeritorhiza haematococci]